jgi:aerotaxis receptor
MTNPPSSAVSGEARKFAINELFFSTTDRHGVIVSGNSVFVRVSAYEPGELLGQPHNLIRHPDMPRAAFRLVWSHLRAGQSVVAYVKNRAKDGRHYWVLALITPIDDGYLSIRLKPSSSLLPVVEQLYRRMVAAEKEAMAQNAGGPAAMDAAEEILRTALRERGFPDYDAFMRAILATEIKSRDATAAREGLFVVPSLPHAGPAGAAAIAATAHSIYQSARGAYSQIERLYLRLDELAALIGQLESKARFVCAMTGDFRLMSLNASIKSDKLGGDGQSLGVISKYLGDASALIASSVADLTARIGHVTDNLRDVAFNLTAARLQIETIMVFCVELCTEREAAAGEPGAPAMPRRVRMIGELAGAFRRTEERAIKSLDAVAGQLHGLDTNSTDLHRTILTVQVAQVGGLVEACRVDRDGVFAGVFAEIRGKIEATKKELGELVDFNLRLEEIANDAPEISRQLLAAVTRIQQDLENSSAA